MCVCVCVSVCTYVRVCVCVCTRVRCMCVCLSFSGSRASKDKRYLFRIPICRYKYSCLRVVCSWSSHCITCYYNDHAGSIPYLLSYHPPPPLPVPLASVDSETHGRTSCPGLTTTAVSVLPSRYIRMYTVYHVHIQMSEEKIAKPTYG